MKKVFLILLVFLFQIDLGYAQGGPDSSALTSATKNGVIGLTASGITGANGKNFIAQGLGCDPPCTWLISLGTLLVSQSGLFAKGAKDSYKTAGDLKGTTCAYASDNCDGFKYELKQLDKIERDNINSIKEALSKDPNLKDKLKLDSKGQLTLADGSPLTASEASLAKLGLSEAETQKVLSGLKGSMDKAAKKAMAAYLKSSKKRGLASNKKQEKRVFIKDDFSSLFKNMHGKKENKKFDVNDLHKNLNGERIGIKQADIFEMTHRLYKHKMDQGIFLIDPLDSSGNK